MYKLTLAAVKATPEKAYRSTITRVPFSKSCLIFGLDTGEKNVLLNYDTTGKNLHTRYLLSK